MADESKGPAGTPGPKTGPALPTAGPKGATGAAPTPLGKIVPPQGGSGTAPPQGDAGRHADHSGVKKVAETREKEAGEQKAARTERRKRLSSGTIPGNWFVAGGRLVNLENVFHIDLPTEGDGAGVVTITAQGGAVVTVAGEDAKEFMEEYQLKPVPAVKPGASESLNVNGRVVTVRDAEAEKDRGRVIETVPTGQHRASAVLTAGETEDDVQRRAGSAPIPDRAITGNLPDATAGTHNPTSEGKPKPAAGTATAIDTSDEPESRTQSGESEGGDAAQPAGNRPETAPQGPNAAQPGKTPTPAQKAAETRRANADGANTGKPRR